MGQTVRISTYIMYNDVSSYYNNDITFDTINDVKLPQL